MNTPTQRTPGPWHGARNTELQSVEIRSQEGGEWVATCYRVGQNHSKVESKANAAFIVEACNNYDRVCAERDELAKALHELVDFNVADIEEGKRGYAIGSPRHAMWKRARAALAKVTP